LRQIAHFQSQVVSLAPQVSQLENDLASTSSSKAAFPHLYRLRNLPFAYSASVVEIVRRKEYGLFLSEWTTKLKEVLTNFTGTENTRRQKIREDVISHLPFTLPALDDSMRVAVEVGVSTGLDVLKGVTLERKDVEGEFVTVLSYWPRAYELGLLHWVESLREDPEILGAIAEGDMGPVRFLEEHLATLIGNMDVATGELGKMISDTGLFHLFVTRIIAERISTAGERRQGVQRYVVGPAHCRRSQQRP
jgi:autophagy-related protein 11